MTAGGALLDINVLLALAWPNHQHHAAAHKWFEKSAQKGWATCALTQLGFIRLSSNPAFTPEFVTPREAAELLEAFTKDKYHRFWHSPVASSQSFAHALNHQQVNDAWLVSAARINSGRVVTFDIRLAAHAGREKNLVDTLWG